MPFRRVARTAVQASLVVALLGSWPAAVAASGPTQISGQPASRALCPPATPGTMTCDALISTLVKPLARAAIGSNFVPPGYGPADLLSAYALPNAASGAGSGVTVAVVDAYDLATAESDLGTYRSQFGLSACTTANHCFRKVDQTGGTSYPTTDPGWNGETALDIEMVSAICPNCKIILVEATDSSGNNMLTAENEAVALGANVVTNSWGGLEFPGEASLDASYLKHPGVAVTFSTGDDGYGVQWPAASPWVTAVGGTTLTTAANSRGWSETAWSGAGSGCSSQEAKPSFQSDPSCSNRTIADVSAVADPATGVAVYSVSQGGWVRFGGTSVASPIIGGVFALAGKPTAGTYPVSYLYSQSDQLNDIVGGSTGSCGGSYLCTAVAGYDGPTGLGTPDGPGALTSPVVPGAPSSVAATADKRLGRRFLARRRRQRPPDHRLHRHLDSRRPDLHDDRQPDLHGQRPDEWDLLHVQGQGHELGRDRSRLGRLERGDPGDSARCPDRRVGEPCRRLGPRELDRPGLERRPGDHRLHGDLLAGRQDLHDERRPELLGHGPDERHALHVHGDGHEPGWHRRPILGFSAGHAGVGARGELLHPDPDPPRRHPLRDWPERRPPGQSLADIPGHRCCPDEHPG